MELFHIKSLVLTVAVYFFFFSITGCGSSNVATKHLDKYNEKTYTDEATFFANKDDVYKATVLALQQRGYLVTLSDAQTGLINGEINGATILPEEQKQISSNTSNDIGAGEIIIGILGIILIVGLIAMLTSDSSKEKESDSNSTTTTTTTTTVVASTPEKITSYKYVVTLNTTTLNDTSSQLLISAVRMVIENGSVTNSGKFENKYLNYGLFDAVQEQLDGFREK